MDYCVAHKDYRVEHTKELRAADPNRKLYHCVRWFRLRRMILEDNYLCQRIIAWSQLQCENSASIVHHLRSPKEYPAGMYDPANLVALCSDCHPGGEAGTPNWKVDHDYIATIFTLPTF
jgi:5-methylcytosine-specific restriction endonuclease McrA